MGGVLTARLAEFIYLQFILMLLFILSCGVVSILTNCAL